MRNAAAPSTNGSRIVYSIADQNFARGKSLGILNVSMNLLRELARQPGISSLTVLSNSTLEADLHLPGKVVIRHHDEAIAGRVRRMIWDQWGVYRAAAREGSEWLFLAKGFASFMRRCPVKLAAVVYDAMTDYYDTHYPGVVPHLENLYFQKSILATLRNADVIFTISDFTSGEVRRLADKNKLHCPPVITMGIGFDGNRLAPYAERRQGILVLASRWPHKRSKMAGEYMRRWQEKVGFQDPIHWVGSLPPNMVSPAPANWEFHPRMSDEQYEKLMAGARVVLFTSEYEGFGMPPVEAALAGACPVYSDIPVTREVMAGMGCSFANESYESFEEAMNKALGITAETIESWARQLLSRHNWNRVCSRVIEGLLSAQKG
jgi:glycosyltransferase involved in cell wall biosynthesis